MDLRKRPSADTKLVARYAISTFGAPPSVWRFTCEPEGLSVDIGGCADRPMAGVLSYTTIGLSDYDLALGPEPGKGDSPHLPERPVGCCAQMGTVPFIARDNFQQRLYIQSSSFAKRAKEFFPPLPRGVLMTTIKFDILAAGIRMTYRGAMS